jgi:hypothetical protein
MHHPSFTWMVQQQYVARLAAVQQVSSGNPHNTWTVQRRNTVARLATIQRGSSLTMVHGSCTMHPSEVICILFSAQPFGQARMISAWMVHTAFQLYVCAWRLPF